MNIGALDKYITIQSLVETKNTTNGGIEQSWTNLCSVWATQTYPQSLEANNEGVEQSRETAITPVNFTIWYRTDITPKMRVYYNSTYFDIKRVNQAGQRNEMLKLVTIKKD
jgi:SPP1 family predicted phage head-tail adaptor